MAADLLDGFELIANDRRLGGSYEADVPWRFVGHTTEVVPSSVAGARALAKRHPTPPHLWCWPEKDWKAQTVLLSRSAFALLHPRGTPHTNKMRALQVEIIGYAKDSPHQPDWWWEWIGTEVVAPVIAAGYPINLEHVAELTGSDGYGARGSVRMTRSEWRHFDGLCSHSNVPDNAHWDIGDGRLDLVANAAARALHMPTTHTEDLDDMHAGLIIAAYAERYGELSKQVGADITAWIHATYAKPTKAERDGAVAYIRAQLGLPT